MIFWFSLWFYFFFLVVEMYGSVSQSWLRRSLCVVRAYSIDVFVFDLNKIKSLNNYT